MVRNYGRGMFYQVSACFRPFPLVMVWWARQDLNLQPTDYESAALTRLSYGPLSRQGTGPLPATLHPAGGFRSADGNSPSPSA